MIKREETTSELLHKYPTMRQPIRCENGCGSVIELLESFRSYKRDGDGVNLLVCECCASEEGHIDEDIEEPEESPVCRRKPKRQVEPEIGGDV